MPTILGANSVRDTGYDVANSCRFNGASDDGLNRTLGTPTNNYKWTISFWLKRTELGVEDAIMTAYTNNQNRGMLLFRTDDQLEILDLQSDSYVMQKKTNRKFRDTSAWYNIIISSDATLSSPETKFYVNGVEETSFATTNEYTQNQANKWNSAIANYIGNDSSTRDFSGYLAEFVFIDGQALDQTSFGEFDSDSPNIWKPIDVSGLTFGNNGFYLDFEDSSNLGNDANGGTDWTVSNLTAIDQSTDTCTNNFATFNPLDVTSNQPTFTEGNTKMTTSANNDFNSSSSTIAVNNGKWYVEFISVSGVKHIYGIVAANQSSGSSFPGKTSLGWGYFSGGGQVYHNDNTSSYGASFSGTDVIGVYLNLDDDELRFSKNGTIQNSGTAIDISSASGEFMMFRASIEGSSQITANVNFGSPAYSISSGNSDANGYGNFEYSPTLSGVNYYALNTKNLAEFG